jgi:methylenetetrahydrofolate--tRNA-(uracil-5-)-methyltransferase
VHDFDKATFFEGCLPIEVMAHRGRDTLRFGPMKPVGLVDPRTAPSAAVVQLRQDTSGDHWELRRLPDANQVGRLLRAAADPGSSPPSSPARHGERNTYINGPTVLRDT